VRKALNRNVTWKVERLAGATRVGLVLGAAALAALLVVARCLEPDERGHGTHEQLGLPACAFRATTGEPCPACGLTTAFAWFARGRIDRAIGANAAGGLLAPACVVLIPWLLASSYAGRACWGARTIDGPILVLSLATVALGLAAWTVRLILGRVLG
jgi:hypothetical protein